MKDTVMRSIAAALVMVICSGSLLYGQGGLVPIDQIYDFGAVGIDFTLFHDFRLINQGEKPVRLDSVKVACDCSRVWLVDTTLDPGDTGIISLQFNTKDYYGRTSKALHVYADSVQTAHFECFYLSTVGQWMMGLKPDPISLFFLPGHEAKNIKILNPALDGVEVIDIDTHNDWIEVKALEEQAGKQEVLLLQVVAADGLTKGTYQTNFRITLSLPEEFEEPLFITVPVKIVRY
ncbi:MAG: DUF1573 domain-containing protein [Candidatus Zixiibacteriota bacterium]|nr:MAG: DUF1573 domain-containing protein [candidate division Zixibacteria bacterium]